MNNACLRLANCLVNCCLFLAPCPLFFFLHIASTARKVLDVVRGLTIMTSKQLAAVSHLLPPGTVEAVGLAARLPRSNQVGRARALQGVYAQSLQ